MYMLPSGKLLPRPDGGQKVKFGLKMEFFNIIFRTPFQNFLIFCMKFYSKLFRRLNSHCRGSSSTLSLVIDIFAFVNFFDILLVFFLNFFRHVMVSFFPYSLFNFFSSSDNSLYLFFALSLLIILCYFHNNLLLCLKMYALFL